jgi:hypothetical protein
MESEIILGLISILIKDGIPALVGVITAWKVADPNMEDIKKLHDLVKKPEDY